MAYPFPVTQDANSISKIDLSFDGLISRYKGYFATLPETRSRSNTSYTMLDAALSGFAVFFMQQPSFLAKQKLLQKKHNKSNAQSLFTIENIPSDNQVRNILDPLSPECLSPLFDDLYNGLYQYGYLEKYKAVNDNLLIAIDGTQYFSSNNIHCKNCSTCEHSNGDITYSHKAITPVIVNSGTSDVISLPPEFIVPQDGCDKQDSEHKAANRWLNKHGHKYKEFAGATILGDDLYSHQPLCEDIHAQGMHFILTCKESTHKTLYEYINGANQVDTVTVNRKVGKKKFVDTYRFINQLPIRDGKDALLVNWCELITLDVSKDKISAKAYISDHTITAENVALIVRDGRARWHIENGCNNVMKKKGYHMEHNFGHGKQHLASFLLCLNLLAFLFHTILQFHDVYYQAIRKELPSRQAFFQSLWTLTTFMLFKSWRHLMEFMADGLELYNIDTG